MVEHFQQTLTSAGAELVNLRKERGSMSARIDTLEHKDALNVATQRAIQASMGMDTFTLHLELAELQIRSAENERRLRDKEEEFRRHMEGEFVRKVSALEQDKKEEGARVNEILHNSHLLQRMHAERSAQQDSLLRAMSDSQIARTGFVEEEPGYSRQPFTEGTLLDRLALSLGESELLDELKMFLSMIDKEHTILLHRLGTLNNEKRDLSVRNHSITEELRGLMFMVDTRSALARFIFELQQMCENTNHTIGVVSSDCQTRDLPLKSLLYRIDSIRQQVDQMQQGFKWVLGNLFTRVELLHIGSSPAKFDNHQALSVAPHVASPARELRQMATLSLTPHQHVRAESSSTSVGMTMGSSPRLATRSVVPIPMQGTSASPSPAALRTTAPLERTRSSSRGSALLRSSPRVVVTNSTARADALSPRVRSSSLQKLMGK